MSLYASSVTPNQRRKALREGLKSNKIQRLPGAFSPLVSRAIEEAGFEGVYVSGAVVAADLGLPDIGLTTSSRLLPLKWGGILIISADVWGLKMHSIKYYKARLIIHSKPYFVFHDIYRGVIDKVRRLHWLKYYCRSLKLIKVVVLCFVLLIP